MKEVLLVYGDRKRPVIFRASPGDPSAEQKNLYDAVRVVFEDILATAEGSSSTCHEKFYLEFESDEWGGEMVDVSGSIVIPDKAIVYLRKPSCARKEIKDATAAGHGELRGLCERLRKPSEMTKKALSTLFPACASRSSKKRKFDPTEESVVATQQKKKKASNTKYKGRCKSVNVVVLKELPNIVPRGSIRTRLETFGRIKDLYFHRVMSEKEVNDVILSGFEDIGVESFRFLKALKGNTLTVAKKQELDGTAIIKMAGSGSVYLQEYPPLANYNVPSSRADTQLELTERVSNEPQPIWISSESENDEVNIQENKSDRQRIIEEQDHEYFEGLQADIAKEEARIIESENQKKIEEIQTEWKQQIKELQDKMKSKFVGSNEIDGVKVGFKLPDGTKTDYLFSKKAVVKDMYQFVVSKEILPPFTLFLLHPTTPLPLSVMADQPITTYENTLLFVIMDDDSSSVSAKLDILASFEDCDVKTDVVNCAVTTDIIVDGDITTGHDVVDEKVVRKDEEERMAFMTSINATVGPDHFISRSTIYEDVLNLYQSDEITKECPIYIEFIGEIAVDYGGVQRDMYAGFWHKAYSVLFEGATLLTPMIHPQMDMNTFTVIGRILSHGYMVSGTLPIRIALPTLICMLLGPAAASSISDKVLLNTFLDFISTYERSTLKLALACDGVSFPVSVQEELTTVLGGFGCRQLPTPSNLPKLVIQVARYIFLTKPAASIAMIHCGVSHREFWCKKSPEDLCCIYQRLTTSPKKVISLIEIPEVTTAQEDRVSHYLRTMIGNMQPGELRSFMRFVTGSCVCITYKIKITFNSLSGFARRPIAHMCTCTLEIPVTYVNYDDFHNEFYSILTNTNDEFSWRMDAL